MKRTLLTLAPLIFAPVCADSQVRIIIPASTYGISEQIPARISNSGGQSISYCVEFGQWSIKTDKAGQIEAESTPYPFYVQIYVQKKFRGKWSTLLIGPDVGSYRKRVALESGQSSNFPFRLVGTGRMRLALSYSVTPEEANCPLASKGKKTVYSRAFTVRYNLVDRMP